jgi:ATP phosphoribosyltransferase
MAAVIQSLIAQVQHDAKAIQAKDIKIEALTHELAHIRRIRYGVKSETLSPLQRDVFEETWNTDVSAIEASATIRIIYRSIAWSKSPPVTRSYYPVPHWLNGLGVSVLLCNR